MELLIDCAVLDPDMWVAFATDSSKGPSTSTRLAWPKYNPDGEMGSCSVTGPRLPSWFRRWWSISVIAQADEIGFILAIGQTHCVPLEA